MSFSEIGIIFLWWSVLFFLTLAFLPLTKHLFSTYLDKGYIFIKTLSIVLISYSVFFLGILHLVPFSQLSAIVLLLVLGSLIYYCNRKHPVSLKQLLPIMVIEEALFFLIMLFWVFVRGYNPEIHGLEKYMDFGFMNAILRSDYFPPKDMWLTPYHINYYYFGHLTTAVLTKLSGIPSNYTYNLMLGTIVGLCFTSGFSLGINLIKECISLTKRGYSKLLFAGLLTAFLLTFSGNLHTVYTFFKPYENEKPAPPIALVFPFKISENCSPKPAEKIDCFLGMRVSTLGFSPASFPNSYWYPNATRFIYNTIHEFPIYSWIVADLHGHVLDIPFVLLTVGLLFSLYSMFSAKLVADEKDKKRKKTEHRSKFSYYFTEYTKYLLIELTYLVLIGLLLGVMYMTNAWDGLIYLLLTGLVFILIAIKPIEELTLRSLKKIIIPIAISSITIFLLFILFALPFSLQFKPFVSGIGVLCIPNTTIQGLSNMMTGTNAVVDHVSIGPLLLEKDHCQKSPLWQLLILYGFFFFFITCFLVFLRKNKKLLVADGFALSLIVLSLLLIIIPEFIYVKDIYPAHYRANTMFKLVFQAFMLLSVVSGYVIVRILSSSKELFRSNKGRLFIIVFFPLTVLLLTLVFIYPFLATKSYYNNLQTYIGMDGTKYLQTLHADDYKAITWINKNIPGQPVILEGQGDSYTDYGRISSNTGLPTVLGWTVHEWLWRGRYDLADEEKKTVTPQTVVDVPAPRISEISTLYESENATQTQNLIKKYAISYIYVGELEREKYPKLTESVFKKLGKIVYTSGTVTIYRMNDQ